jgi:hypothetical protein
MKITELKATSLGARIQISSLASINRSESSTKRRAVKLVQTLSLRQGDGGREARGPSALLRVVAQGCAGQRRRRRARTGVHRHQPDAGQLHGRRGRGQGAAAARRVVARRLGRARHVPHAVHRGAQRRAQRHPRAGSAQGPGLRCGHALRPERCRRLRRHVPGRRRRRGQGVADAEGESGRHRPHHRGDADRYIVEIRTGVLNCLVELLV